MAIYVTLLSGPLAGRTREMPAEINPNRFFGSLIEHKYKWRVDYSRATEKETFLWFRAELAARIVRALLEGRPVKFLDREWQVEKIDDLRRIAQEVEDFISSSGRLITIQADDESGLIISAEGYEQ